MGRFSNIYPFTTENIAGYMEDLDLRNKRIVTVTGSTDHIINAILCGALEIKTFDVNPLAKKYMDLKLAGIKYLSFEEFLQMFLYNSDHSLDFEVIRSLPMEQESKNFWLEQLSKFNNDGLALKKSGIFRTPYFRIESTFVKNLYLDKRKYRVVKERINEVKIDSESCNLTDLVLDREYDYMFLSNISDYLNLMFKDHNLVKYKELIYKFLEKVKSIYFAYLYDIGNSNPRSEIDDVDKVKEIFGSIEIKKFKSALNGEEETKKDGVLILRRNGNGK